MDGIGGGGAQDEPARTRKAKHETRRDLIRVMAVNVAIWKQVVIGAAMLVAMNGGIVDLLSPP